MSWSPEERRWRCAFSECPKPAKPRWVPGFKYPENFWPLGMCEDHDDETRREMTEEEMAVWEVMSI